MLFQKLESFCEFSSSNMNTNILWVLLKSLGNWVSSVVRRDKYFTFELCDSLSLIRSDSWIISHINIDLVFISPCCTFKLVDSSLLLDFLYFLILLSWLLFKDISNLFVCCVVLIGVKEHILFVSSLSFLSSEHLGGSLSFFSTKVNHWPLTLLLLAKDRTKR